MNGEIFFLLHHINLFLIIHGKIQKTKHDLIRLTF